MSNNLKDLLEKFPYTTGRAEKDGELWLRCLLTLEIAVTNYSLNCDVVATTTHRRRRIFHVTTEIIVVN